MKSIPDIKEKFTEEQFLKIRFKIWKCKTQEMKS